MSERRYILLGSSKVLLIRVAGAALAMGAQIAIARIIGRAEYGIYAYAMSVVILLATVSRLGIDNALPRLIPVMLSDGRNAEYRGTLRLAFIIPLLLTAACAAGLICYMTLSQHQQDTRYRAATLLMLLALPPLTLAFVSRSAMVSIRHLVWGEMPDIVIRPVLLGLGVLGVYCFFKSPTAEHIVLTFFGSTVVSLAISLVTLWRAQPKLEERTGVRYPTTEVLRIAMPMLLMNGFLIFVGEFTVIMLGAYREPEQVAVYAAAVRLSLLVNFALTAVNSTVSPVISNLYNSGDRTKLQTALRQAAAWMIGPTLAAAVGIVVLGQYALKLFGPGFDEGYPVLLILLGGQIVNAITGPVNTVLKMCNQEKVACAAMMLAAVVNVSGCFILIPQYGAYGASISISASYAASNLAMLLFTHRTLGLNPTILPLPTRKNMW